MSNSRESSTFTTTDIHGSEWRVHVSRDAVEDALRSDRTISDDEMDQWVDDNATMLSDIALAKIARNECGSDSVRLNSADVESWKGSSQR